MLSTKLFYCRKLFINNNNQCKLLFNYYCTRQSSLLLKLTTLKSRCNYYCTNNSTNTIIKNKFKNLQLIKKCSIHLTPKRYNPIVSIIVRQLLKITTMFTARAIRKWYKNLSTEKKQYFIQWLNKHKLKFFSIFTLLFLLFYLYYQLHLELTPITKRKRFIIFTNEQFDLLNKFELQTILEQYSDQMITDKNNPITRRVINVVKKLIESNQDLDEIKNFEWTISIIQNDEIINAFVLPTGNIFIFTGLLKLIGNNDDQLAIILSHELSHAILLHGIELASYAQIVDFLFIILLAIIWMFLPTDFISAISTFISKFILNIIMETPYNKMLETEADQVGINLATKACFDIRDATVFWSKMSYLEKIQHQELFGENQESKINLDFLSTHPSHEERSKNLDKLINDLLLIREKIGCPPLKHPDPRLKLKLINDDDNRMHELIRKEFDGIFHIKDFKTA